jgi:hypothetical protein
VAIGGKFVGRGHADDAGTDDSDLHAGAAGMLKRAVRPAPPR